jgi:hypothetical protein
MLNEDEALGKGEMPSKRKALDEDEAPAWRGGVSR